MSDTEASEELFDLPGETKPAKKTTRKKTAKKAARKSATKKAAAKKVAKKKTARAAANKEEEAPATPTAPEAKTEPEAPAKAPEPEPTGGSETAREGGPERNGEGERSGRPDRPVRLGRKRRMPRRELKFSEGGEQEDTGLPAADKGGVYSFDPDEEERPAPEIHDDGREMASLPKEMSPDQSDTNAPERQPQRQRQDRQPQQGDRGENRKPHQQDNQRSGGGGGGGNSQQNRSQNQRGGGGGNQQDRNQRGGGKQQNRNQQKGQDSRGQDPRGQDQRQNSKKKKKKKSKKEYRSKPEMTGLENVAIEVGLLPDEEFFRDENELGRLAEAASGGGEPVQLNELISLPLQELVNRARDMGLSFAQAPTKRKVVSQLIAKCHEQRIPVFAEGVLESDAENDFGTLLYPEENYRERTYSAFIHQDIIKRYGLRRGQTMRAQLLPEREDGNCPVAVKLDNVLGRPPEEAAGLPIFEELTPYYPTERILLENEPTVAWDNISMRVIDLLTPIGLGQRGLIVAPPRVGKTVILQCMANTIAVNKPDAHLMVVLIDERPEEVTDFKRQVNGEVVSSTFDEDAESHVNAAEVVIEKARRMVEAGRDVIILLDSITRLARAYNTLMPSSGKILSGGVEASALQRPKRFFGSARNIEEGGSLTIMGTALVETNSRMDEVVFEEFKGTGNMELHLDRALADKRIFPAINWERSGTRKEELLYHPDEMQKIFSLRRAMKGVPAVEAMEMLIQRIKKTKTNAEFLMTLGR